MALCRTAERLYSVGVCNFLFNACRHRIALTRRNYICMFGFCKMVEQALPSMTGMAVAAGAIGGVIRSFLSKEEASISTEFGSTSSLLVALGSRLCCLTTCIARLINLAPKTVLDA